MESVQMALQRARVEGEAQAAQLQVAQLLVEAWWWPEWSEGQLTVVAQGQSHIACSSAGQVSLGVFGLVACSVIVSLSQSQKVSVTVTVLSFCARLSLTEHCQCLFWGSGRGLFEVL